MPFRRLKHKTQVFFAPENDHVCTRIEHVLHVATIASTICKGLNKYGCNLNQEMAYAIGLGHDLGHAPFGHAGETALNRKLNGDNKFIHEVNSYRVVEYLKPSNERNDLNKINNRKHISCSYEGCIVRFADKIAYLGRDIEDALVADFIKSSDIPEKISTEVGLTNGEIINKLIIDLIENSKNKEEVGFSNDMFEKLNILKNFNYRYIYNHPSIQHYRKMGEKILEELFDYLLELYSNFGHNYEKYRNSEIPLVARFGKYLEKMKKFYDTEGNIPKQIICDYISGMTDTFALEAMKQIKIPLPIKFK